MSKSGHPNAVEMVFAHYVTDAGTANGFRWIGPGSDYEDSLREPEYETTWVCEADDTPEEAEVSLTVTQFAELLAKAKLWDRHKVGCIGC